MKTVMAIPTYWGRDSKTGWQLGDQIYDHPVPIDEEGTLGRLIDSMKVLNDKDFELVILVAVTTPELRDAAFKKVNGILKSKNLAVKTYVIGDQHLDEITTIYQKSNLSSDLLSLQGYSNIRNMCLYSAYLLKAKIVVSIDDDEVFEDPEFMEKAREFIGGRLYGQTVDGIAGYYLNKNNNYYDDVEIEPWMTFWNRFGYKAEAFDKIINGEPRLKKTPFAFGGLMVIHRNLLKVVPFDPRLTRGEDIDYLINARMFGFNFFLDNQLAIKHLSPGKKHPIWQRLRQNIYRFFYEKAKIESQVDKPNMIKVEPEDFSPYPGEFLKPDLEDKVFKTNLILALDYLSNNKIDECKATIKNIYLTKYDAVPKDNIFNEYLKTQNNWSNILEFADNNLSDLSPILEAGIINKASDKPEHTVGKITDSQIYAETLNLPIFKSLSPADARDLIDKCEFSSFKKNNTIVKKGVDDNAIYIIIEGKVKLVKHEKDIPEEILLAQLKKGEFFGLSSLISSKSSYYMVDVIAEEPVILTMIKRENLMEFFEENHKSSIKLILYLMKEINDQLEDLTDMYTDIQSQTVDIMNRIDNNNQKKS
jgi:CRP-like cAMP-binding protein